MIQTEMTERQSVPTTRDMSAQLSEACAHAMEAADAQLAISTLKTTRLIVLVAVAIVALLALTTVAGYGLFLLDGCLAYALSAPTFPAWFAALARGILYTLTPAAGFYFIWRNCIGFDENPTL
jgi:hypothetical protein